MTQATYDKNSLILLKGRVTCKLAEIHQMLAPGIVEPASAEALQEAAERHMASLPPARQEKLRLKAMVAYAELQRLSDEMARHVESLTLEINKVSRHKRAAIAYRQAPALPGYHGASL